MKKLMMTLVLAVAASFTALYAQNGKKVDGAQFNFKGGDTWDFGNVEKGPVAEHTFEFTNTGNQPLIIMDVKPSCGCTHVDWDKQPVLPGQTGHISLGLKTDEQTGIFKKEIYIQSTAVVPNGEKRYTIYFKGNAVDKDKMPARDDKKKK